MKLPPVQWTPAMDALLGTDSDHALAKLWGLSENVIWKRRKKLGIPNAIKPYERAPTPSAKLKGAWYVAYMAKGMRQCDVARLFGIKAQTVRRDVKRYLARTRAESGQAR